MLFDEKYWLNKPALTVEQVAVLACGGNPTDMEFIKVHEAEIKEIYTPLAIQVKADLKKVHELYDVAKLLDEVFFYKSIERNDFLALKKEVHPTSESIELEVSEIKAWLASRAVKPQFFFSDDDEFIVGKIASSSKELNPRERNTLLVLLAATLKELEIDYEQRGVATSIQHLTEKLGATVSGDTIRKYLKLIPDAVNNKS